MPSRADLRSGNIPSRRCSPTSTWKLGQIEESAFRYLHWAINEVSPSYPPSKPRPYLLSRRSYYLTDYIHQSMNSQIAFDLIAQQSPFIF